MYLEYKVIGLSSQLRISASRKITNGSRLDIMKLINFMKLMIEPRTNNF